MQCARRRPDTAHQCCSDVAPRRPDSHLKATRALASIRTHRAVQCAFHGACAFHKPCYSHDFGFAMPRGGFSRTHYLSHTAQSSPYMRIFQPSSSLGVCSPMSYRGPSLTFTLRIGDRKSSGGLYLGNGRLARHGQARDPLWAWQTGSSTGAAASCALTVLPLRRPSHARGNAGETTSIWCQRHELLPCGVILPRNLLL